MNNNSQRHGGDIYRNHVKYDFSVNINPLPLPDKIIDTMHRTISLENHYPDSECESLKEKLKEYTGIPIENMLVGNGASELIMHVFLAERPKVVLLEKPSFSGYERAAKAVDARISYVAEDALFEDRKAALISSRADMIVLARPNNPTGYMSDKNSLFDLLDFCEEKGITVLLDECFYSLSSEALLAGYCSAISIKRLLRSKHLVVLRAFTKCYGLPGIRLGVAFTGEGKLRDNIAKSLPEWNVSVLAQETGIACLDSPEYVAEYRDIIKSEKPRLERFLNEHRFRLLSRSQACFIFFQAEFDLYLALLRKGILIRDCANMTGQDGFIYRIAVKTRAENDILIGALQDILKDNKN